MLEGEDELKEFCKYAFGGTWFPPSREMISNSFLNTHLTRIEMTFTTFYVILCKIDAVHPMQKHRG